MTHVRIKGFKIYRDRHGKMRCYHRATGNVIDLMKHPLGSVSFMAECQKIDSTNIKPRAGTLKSLIHACRSSPHYQGLKPKTHEFYEGAMEYLRPIDDTNLSDFTSGLIVRIRDKAHAKRGWHFANRVVTTLSMLFSWAEERGEMDSNPAEGIKRIPRPKDKERANRPWTDAERYTVLIEALPHVRATIGLMMFLGADPIDAITILKTQRKGNTIGYARTKTGEETVRAMPFVLRAIIRGHRHGADTIAANSAGNPWTKSGFDSTWAKLRGRLEQEGKIEKGLTLKGLRHTHASILGEMGMDDRTIGDALAQASEGMARWYSRDADRRKKLEDVTRQYDIEERKRRKNLSNLIKKVSNPKSGNLR